MCVGCLVPVQEEAPAYEMVVSGLNYLLYQNVAQHF